MSVRDIVMAASGAAAGPTYIEDVFSTYLYTGTEATQTISNGIDLAGTGGLVWLKYRNGNTGGYDSHYLFDTERTNQNTLSTNTTQEQIGGWGNQYFRFLSNGFDTGVGGVSDQQYLNRSGVNYASWTFRKAPKFFDVVTWTGNGVAGRTVAHSLGSVPGMIIVKQVDVAADWYVYHRSLGNNRSIHLNLNESQSSIRDVWNNTTPTSTNFTLGGQGWNVNNSGRTYVAYLFAHDTTTDGLIQCGSVSQTAGSDGVVNLGWEPQYVMWKYASGTEDPVTGDWNIFDSMRGMFADGKSNALYANSSVAEQVGTGSRCKVFSTGFSMRGMGSGTGTFIYMAIRRGPMKTPTVGTSVFSPTASSSAAGTALTTGFPIDSQWAGFRPGDSNNFRFFDRLRGVNTITDTRTPYLQSSTTAAEDTDFGVTALWNNTGFSSPTYLGSGPNIFWNFRRAPGFFDVVCYTGTGVATNFNHNLGVAPELLIVKRRSSAADWIVYSSALGNTKVLFLNTTDPQFTYSGAWNNTSPTSSVFTVGNATENNISGSTYVAYLFASCPGVSKVGSYTGNGSSQTINCGFAAGARFVLIKRTDSTGDWYVWDTARGMVAGTDPSLLLNSTAAEVNANSVYTTTGGFQIVSTDAGINASGGSYIYLAVA